MGECHQTHYTGKLNAMYPWSEAQVFFCEVFEDPTGQCQGIVQKRNGLPRQQQPFES